MTLEIERSFLYFRILDAVQKSYCPVCYYANKSVWNYIDSLLYERVNDPGTRLDMKSSKGYCSIHAAQFVRAGDAFGTTILYRDLIQLFKKDISEIYKNYQTEPSIRDKLRNWINSIKKKVSIKIEKICPICSYQTDTIKMTVSLILDYLKDDDFKKIYRESYGLCNLHFLQGLKCHPNQEIADVLTQKERLILTTLDYELGEFIRKQDYRYSDEPIGSEGNAWIRAIEHLTGKNWYGFQKSLDLSNSLVQIQLKLGKLERENERLREGNTRLNNAETKAASLHFRTHQQAKDIQTLEFQLSGIKADRDNLSKFIEMQKKEIQVLKKQLANFSTEVTTE